MIKESENRKNGAHYHPQKKYVATVAYGPWKKGQVFTCNEPMRTVLLTKKIEGVAVIRIATEADISAWEAMRTGIPLELIQTLDRPILTRRKN